MTTQKGKKSIKGFAVFIGPLIVWGTLRPTRADSEAAYLKHNPQIDGTPPAYRVLPVAVELEDFHQLSFADDL